MFLDQQYVNKATAIKAFDDHVEERRKRRHKTEGQPSGRLGFEGEVCNDVRHYSAAYAEALRALGDGAVRDVRIVEGLEVATLPFRRGPGRPSLGECDL